MHLNNKKLVIYAFAQVFLKIKYGKEKRLLYTKFSQFDFP